MLATETLPMRLLCHYHQTVPPLNLPDTLFPSSAEVQAQGLGIAPILPLGHTLSPSLTFLMTEKGGAKAKAKVAPLLRGQTLNTLYGQGVGP